MIRDMTANCTTLTHATCHMPHATVLMSHSKIFCRATGYTCVSSCKYCAKPANRDLYLFDDYGDIPDTVAALNNYAEKRMVALGSTFCPMFRPFGYAYNHIEGDISFGLRRDDFAGMIGVLYSSEQLMTASMTSDLVDRPRTLAALRTLLEINPLFSQFLPTVSTLYGYFHSPFVGPVPQVPQSHVDDCDKATHHTSYVVPNNDDDLLLPSGNADSVTVGFQSIHYNQQPRFSSTAELREAAKL